MHLLDIASFHTFENSDRILIQQTDIIKTHTVALNTDSFTGTKHLSKRRNNIFVLTKRQRI